MIVLLAPSLLFPTNCQELRVTQINTVVNWRHCSVSVKRKKGQKEIGHRKRVSVVALVIDFERPYMFDKEKKIVSFVQTYTHRQSALFHPHFNFWSLTSVCRFPATTLQRPLSFFFERAKKRELAK